MTIKQQGGIFGRNPTFNDVNIEGTLTSGSIDMGSATIDAGTVNASSFNAAVASASLNLGVTGNTSVKYIKFNEASDWSIQSNGSSYLRIYSGGSEAARFDGSQNFSMVNGGNVIMASGNGIDFSATSDASGSTSELFDDYEEGTWTPDPQDSSGNSGSAGTASGYYTKIGNVVFATVLLENIDTTGLTAGQDFRIYGLPYTSKSLVGSQIFTGAARMNDVTFSGNPNLAILDSTDYMRIVESISGSASDFVVVSEIASGTADIYGTITYMAA